MADSCESQLAAAAAALGDYKSARSKAERLGRAVDTAGKGDSMLLVLVLLADQVGREDIEGKAEEVGDAFDDVEALLKELLEQAEQDAEDALQDLDDALDAYCKCLETSDEPAEPVDPGDEEEEEEDEDIFADIDALLEELAEAFDAVEDEWFDGDD